MEPKSPSQLSSPEMGPVQQGGNEQLTPNKAGEQAPQKAPEQQPGSGETREALPAPAAGDPTFVATPPPLPSMQPANDAAQTTTSTPSDDNPLVANDDDLIEKEWVNRAKKIVSDTKYDPYLQEREVSKLQADYLKKRYGKEVKLPEN
jgi:hypothetical protein